MVFNKTEQQEKEYLQQIVDIVKAAINTTDISVNEHVETLKEHKDYLWSNKDIDPQEIRSMRESILNHFALGENVIAKRKRLGKLLDIPYFGRIDFCNSCPESEITPLYIGIHTFYDSNKKTNLIYDWRAPISGMFYDYELGQASYTSPSGEVSGQISLKRQYRIRKGEMEYMIESSLTVHDEILQKELSASTDDKMKNIVATIQREQNRIIRNEEALTLIIQGVAGSGKTSIALHRIAYLLYTFKDEISSKDILIISPNKVFADYISNVLPELGEETVPETSMEKILSHVLDNKFKHQNFFQQVTELLGKPQPGFIERIQYKASFDFLSQLDAFILHIENNYFMAADVKLTRHFTIPSEFIEEQFQRFNRYPMRQRFEVMADYILEIVQIKYRIDVTTANRNMLKKEIRNMFAGNNDLQGYKNFFEWVGKPEMFKLRKSRTLEYADLAPLAYLHIALEGNKPKTQVKHLLIDEMQDHSLIQYKVIQKLYPCRKTILGDAGQSINPHGSSNAEMIKKAFVAGEIMKLNKSYRSTYEITSFAKTIRPNSESEVIERHGEQPRIYQCQGTEDEINAITGLISDFRKSNYQSHGIICKEEAQAFALYEKLKGDNKDIHFLSHQSTTYVNGIIVTSAHMAKGLEFDEVIIPHADKKNYKTEIDKSMLYVAVTRAMHRLSLTSPDEITGFIKRQHCKDLIEITNPSVPATAPAIAPALLSQPKSQS
jgi:DNA helicase-2/ATP-dependent DNA helicase PcrA